MFSMPASALFNNSADEACKGVGVDTATGCAAGTDGIGNLINTVINLLSIVVGIGAVIMIMVGGFKYITSGGDSGKAGSAKSTIMYAVLGLVVVALAQFLVKFVVNAVK